jgi:peroxiredoxin
VINDCFFIGNIKEKESVVNVNVICALFLNTTIMKKTIFLLAVVATLFSCQKNKKTPGYEINGVLKNLPDSSIVYISANNKYIDSTIVLNEQFTLSGKVEAPINVYLMVKNSRNYKSFWLENSKISFEAEQGKFREAKIKGSKTQLEDNILSERLRKIETALKAIEDSYNEKMTEQEMEALEKQYNIIEKSEKGIYQNFIKEFPNSLVSAHILNIYSTTWGKRKTQDLFNSFSLDNKASEYGKKVARYIELNKEPKIGDKFVDFEMTNHTGQLEKLSNTKGKVVLLEFWASWCGPCRQENPNLVKTYEKFNPKGFEIFAVSLDQNKQHWLGAIEEDQLAWEHVSELNGSENKAGLIYGINGIPDNFLIDSDGIIVERNLRGAELDEKLNELFN